MRKPTPRCHLYEWHTAALAGEKPQITSEPRCGWFKRTLVKGGAPVGARIWMEQSTDPDTGELVGDEIIRCEVGGKERDATDEWLWLANYPISEADYLYLIADAQWAKNHAHQAPQANPREPVRSRNIPRLFP